MGRRISAATILMTLVAAMFALLLTTVPAAAHHKDEHLQGGGNGSAASQAGEDGKDNDGDADSDAGTAYTEDDDTNDGGTSNNAPDDGDNAHPSGKDRSVENGASRNQGNSESDPDDDGRGPDRTNGGPDKPNGSGGVDKADQDGNNGCGNDDDFEDDNEGWCGRKPKPSKPAVAPEGPCDAKGNGGSTLGGAVATMPGTQPCKDDSSKPCVDDAGMEGDETCEKGEEILGGVIPRPATPELDAAPAAEEAEVLGERLAQAQPVGAGAARQRGASFLGQTLPFTGSALMGYGALAVGLLLAGAGLLTVRSKA